MSKLTKRYVALDHIIVAMDLLRSGKPVAASKSLATAMKTGDFEEAIAALDEANDVATAKTPTLAEALTMVAKAVKSKKDKKKKKKAKANTEMTISEVALDDLDMTEEDLLDTGDDVAVDVDDDGDLDLDALSLDDDDETLAGDEELLDDDDIVLDEEEEVTEMPEATSAEALGTDAEIKPGKDGTPQTTDNGETPTTVKKEAVPAPESAKTKKLKEAAEAAAKRLMSNVQIVERQSTVAASKAATKLAK